MLDVPNIKGNFERDEGAMQKYKTHPSIQIIKEIFGNKKKTISFDLVSPDTILKEIEPLDPNKTTYSDSVPIKIVKTNADLFLNFVFNAYN